MEMWTCPKRPPFVGTMTVTTATTLPVCAECQTEERAARAALSDPGAVARPDTTEGR